MTMQKMFTAIGVCAVILVLAGSTYKAFAPQKQRLRPDVGPTQPKSLSELPLTQHASFPLGLVGTLTGTVGTPVGITMPSDSGLAIGQLTSSGGAAGPGTQKEGWQNNDLVIRCDGVEVWRGSVAPLNGSTVYSSSPAIFNPPLVFPPGVLMEIFIDSSMDLANNLTLTGYFLTPEDLGL